MQLTNRTILLTGGTSGIGLHLALQLLHRGNQVIICGRRQDKLAALAAQHPGLLTYACDVSDAAQREQLAAWVTSAYPALDVVINNAGLMQLFDLRAPVDSQRLQQEVTTNLIAPIHLGGLLVEHLQRQPAAAIVNVTSGLAFTPLASVPVYSATKAGLHAFCLALRYQLRETPVQVFEIIPPAVSTELGHADGYDRSHDHAMDVVEFTDHVLRVLEQDQYEVGIGTAEGLRQQRDGLFSALNPN
jgi:uncharacterized oxidoreductase